MFSSYFQVEQLTNHLKEKTDKCSELLLSKEQLQRDVQERNEEIEKLECRVRELEQALLATADPFPKVRGRREGTALSCSGGSRLLTQRCGPLLTLGHSAPSLLLLFAFLSDVVCIPYF